MVSHCCMQPKRIVKFKFTISRKGQEDAIWCFPKSVVTTKFNNRAHTSLTLGDLQSSFPSILGAGLSSNSLGSWWKAITRSSISFYVFFSLQ
jgi:hypothetical protein